MTNKTKQQVKARSEVLDELEKWGKEEMDFGVKTERFLQDYGKGRLKAFEDFLAEIKKLRENI